MPSPHGAPCVGPASFTASSPPRTIPAAVPPHGHSPLFTAKSTSTATVFARHISGVPLGGSPASLTPLQALPSTHTTPARHTTVTTSTSNATNAVNAAAPNRGIAAHTGQGAPVPNGVHNGTAGQGVPSASSSPFPGAHGNCLPALSSTPSRSSAPGQSPLPPPPCSSVPLVSSSISPPHSSLQQTTAQHVVATSLSLSPPPHLQRIHHTEDVSPCASPSASPQRKTNNKDDAVHAQPTHGSRRKGPETSSPLRRLSPTKKNSPPARNENHMKATPAHSRSPPRRDTAHASKMSQAAGDVHAERTRAGGRNSNGEFRNATPTPLSTPVPSTCTSFVTGTGDSSHCTDSAAESTRQHDGRSCVRDDSGRNGLRQGSGAGHGSRGGSGGEGAVAAVLAAAVSIDDETFMYSTDEGALVPSSCLENGRHSRESDVSGVDAVDVRRQRSVSSSIVNATPPPTLGLLSDSTLMQLEAGSAAAKGSPTRVQHCGENGSVRSDPAPPSHDASRSKRRHIPNSLHSHQHTCHPHQQYHQVSGVDADGPTLSLSPSRDHREGDREDRDRRAGNESRGQCDVSRAPSVLSNNSGRAGTAGPQRTDRSIATARRSSNIAGAVPITDGAAPTERPVGGPLSKSVDVSRSSRHSRTSHVLPVPVGEAFVQNCETAATPPTTDGGGNRPNSIWSDSARGPRVPSSRNSSVSLRQRIAAGQNAQMDTSPSRRSSSHHHHGPGGIGGNGGAVGGGGSQAQSPKSPGQVSPGPVSALSSPYSRGSPLSRSPGAATAIALLPSSPNGSGATALGVGGAVDMNSGGSLQGVVGLGLALQGQAAPLLQAPKRQPVSQRRAGKSERPGKPSEANDKPNDGNGQSVGVGSDLPNDSETLSHTAPARSSSTPDGIKAATVAPRLSVSLDDNGATMVTASLSGGTMIPAACPPSPPATVPTKRPLPHMQAGAQQQRRMKVQGSSPASTGRGHQGSSGKLTRNGTQRPPHRRDSGGGTATAGDGKDDDKSSSTSLVLPAPVVPMSNGVPMSPNGGAPSSPCAPAAAQPQQQEASTRRRSSSTVRQLFASGAELNNGGNAECSGGAGCCESVGPDNKSGVPQEGSDGCGGSGPRSGTTPRKLDPTDLEIEDGACEQNGNRTDGANGGPTAEACQKGDRTSQPSKQQRGRKPAGTGRGGGGLSRTPSKRSLKGDQSPSRAQRQRGVQDPDSPSDSAIAAAAERAALNERREQRRVDLATKRQELYAWNRLLRAQFEAEQTGHDGGRLDGV